MGMTAFESDMRAMVAEADMSEAKRTLALAYVRDTGKLANGSRGSLEAVCDALVSQTPLFLEMYLAKNQSAADVDAAISRHLADCMSRHVAEATTVAPVIEHRRGQGGDGPMGLNWRRLAHDTISRATWPSAAITLGAMYQDTVCKIVERWLMK